MRHNHLVPLSSQHSVAPSLEQKKRCRFCEKKQHYLWQLAARHEQPQIGLHLTVLATCRRVIDGHILLRDNKVYMRKRCPEHGRFEGLVYGDAEAYISSSRFNKPGTMPLRYSTEIKPRLRPLPRSPSARLPGHHRGQLRL